MNYRHAYHAGNHADILKHIVLTRLLNYLGRKDKPFHVIDAYAGTGLYSLASPEALKTAEWHDGVGKMEAAFAPGAEELLNPFRSVVQAVRAAGGSFPVYPGSPEFACRLTRPQDKLTFNELHPQDFGELQRRYKADPRIRAMAMDAALLVKAYLPPAARRGLVLIDPPFETKTETMTVASMLAQGYRRFANGLFMIWYPLKGQDFAANFCAEMQKLGIAGMLRLELRVKESFDGGGLAGSGLLVVNPPYVLEGEMKILLPALATRLGLGSWGQSLVDWLTPQPKA